VTAQLQVQQCEGVNGLGNFDGPPEQCEQDSLPGSPFCIWHQEEGWDVPPDWDWDEASQPFYGE